MNTFIAILILCIDHKCLVGKGACINQGIDPPHLTTRSGKQAPVGPQTHCMRINAWVLIVTRNYYINKRYFITCIKFIRV